MKNKCRLFKVVMTLDIKGFIDIEFLSEKVKESDVICAKLICRTTIGNSRKEATSRQNLIDIWGVNAETFKKIILLARQSGERIISGVNGYWYSDEYEIKSLAAGGNTL